MFVVMFVHVVPSINAAHEGVVTGHWALDMNGDMHTQDSALGAGANSHQQLISGSEARTEAGPGSLGPLFVARVCDWVSPRSRHRASARCHPGPGSGLEWPLAATTCPSVSVQTRAAQCQHPGPGNTRTQEQELGWTIFCVIIFGFSFGGNDSGFWKAATLISFSEFMNIFSIIEGRQKTNYPCFRSRKISFLGYFTSFQDLGINENAWSLVALFSLFPG